MAAVQRATQIPSRFICSQTLPAPWICQLARRARRISTANAPLALSTLAAQLGLAPPSCVAPMARRGHLLHLADGLGTVPVAVQVDETLQRFKRRRSSAFRHAGAGGRRQCAEPR